MSVTALGGFWRSRFADGQPALLVPHFRDRIESSLMALDQLQLQQSFGIASTFWTELGTQTDKLRPYQVDGGVLLLPVRGVLLNSFPYQVGAYATGYEYIRQAFQRAIADPSVTGIALMIDSPGGAVSGNFDLVDYIYAQRGMKPIKAYVSDAAYSAAYAIASAADEIIVSRTGGTGSIGVVTAHLDVSKAMETDGFKMTFIYAGARKIDGSPYLPLSDEAKATLQGRIDSLYGIFVDTVARNRGLLPTDVRKTEAATYGPGESIAYGLADRLGSPDNVLSDFGSNQGVKIMSKTDLNATANGGSADTWSAEFRGSADLQREFETEDVYIAYRRHEARQTGAQVNQYSETQAAGEKDPFVAEWMRSPELQREFATAEDYAGFKRFERRVHLK